MWILRYTLQSLLVASLLVVVLPVLAQSSSNELFFNPEYGYSGNLSLVSNYVFRGVSLSDDKPAVQGGIDYDSESGFYVGTWASSGSKAAPLEIDIYGAYALTVNEKLDVEARLTGFLYPHATEDNSLEAAFSAYYASTGIRYNYDLEFDEHYLEAGLYYKLTPVTGAKLRGGVLYPENPPQAGTVSTATDDKINPWDIEISLDYTLNTTSSFWADYSYQEIERSNFAVGFTASF